MSRALSNIHPEASKVFNTQLKNQNISHAYLICGSEATMKEELAYALARAIVDSDLQPFVKCSDPQLRPSLFDADLQIYSPAGARGYLAEQIRNIIRDASRAPINSPFKVNILTQAEKLTTATANAFLKTLEEPPSYVVNILIANSVDVVLPTIVSRCQVFTLKDIARSSAVEIVVKESGATKKDAKFALNVTHGNIGEASKVLQDQSMIDLMDFLKTSYLELAALNTTRACKNETTNSNQPYGIEADFGLVHSEATSISSNSPENLTDWDVLQKSAALQKYMDGSIKTYKNELDAKLDDQAEFLDGSAIKTAEKAIKRQVSSRQIWLLKFATSVICVMVEEDLKLFAECARTDKSSKKDAELSIKTNRINDLFSLYGKLSYNISVKNYCDVLLLSIAG